MKPSTITNTDLDQLKKLLDIATDYGIEYISVGSIRVRFKPGISSTQMPMTIDDKETQLDNLKTELQRLSDDTDADTFWST